MGELVLRTSDLTGEVIPEDSERALLIVIEHPSTGRQPIRLEALPSEVEELEQAAVEAVVVALQLPGEEEPHRVVVAREPFDRLSKTMPMGDLLLSLVPPQRSKPERVDYATVEHAGRPHKGTVSQSEASFVREHLAEVNERLAAEGHRPIDPQDEEQRHRYGFAPQTIPADIG